jgi:hypothetical protein
MNFASGLFLLATVSIFAQDNLQPSVSNAKFESRAVTGDLNGALRVTAPTWFAYAIKTPRGEHNSCCYENDRPGCYLEGHVSQTSVLSSKGSPVQLEGSDHEFILLRVENSRIGKIRVLSSECSVDAGGLPFVWLTGVSTESSLRLLESLVSSVNEEHVMDGAVMAIAQHDSPKTDDLLATFVQPDRPVKLREKTVFWIGSSRGERGVTLLKNVIAHDQSEQVRDKTVFALSINKQPEALETLIATARQDPSSHVRGQALFWLGQKAGKRSAAAIQNAIENDPDTDVRKKAVFALSQMPKDESIPKLIEIAKTQRNPEVRKQAFFWLGQSNDPRALEFFAQVLK